MSWYCILFLPGLLISCASPMDKDWIKTQEYNTILGYMHFIDRYPSSSYREEAENKIDQLQFLRAQLENTESAYEEYVKKFPMGQFIADAKVNAQKVRTQNEERAFAEASSKNSSEAFEEFLEHYPKSKIAAAIGEGLEAFYLKFFKDATTTTFFKNFVELFPNSSHRTEALQKLEALHFENALKFNDFVIYESFLLQYPQETFQEKAKKKLEKVVFDKTKEEGSISRYNAFLMKFPQGNFSEAAKDKLEALKEELKKITLLINDAKNKNSITTVSQIIKSYLESPLKNEVAEEGVTTIWEMFSQNYPEDKYNCSTTLIALKQDLPKAMLAGEPLLLGFAPQMRSGYKTWEWTVNIFEIAGNPAILETKSRRYLAPNGEILYYYYVSNLKKLLIN
ncbi:MAG: hypothetical protein R3B74_10765 [Nitrospirales bacterium]|nr:hypothetical protein [Nitrospirales bacterium]